MLLVASPRFDEHTTPPGHPERPERAYVFNAVAARWREASAQILVPRPATREDLLRVHSMEYVSLIERTSGRAVALDPDTFTSPESYAIALLAAGATFQAAEHALATREPSIALVRPPGHHAERDRAMGFCLFNNVAVAAAGALAQGLSRVAIIDIDVHHGNGTQGMFYDDPRVLYVSTHQFPFYPGTGAADEVGEGAGEGFTVNVPLEAGATDADYDKVYAVIARIVDEFTPELLLVSAGFDAHADDPLASMRLTTDGYARVMAHVKSVADRHCPIALVTEGGYDLEALDACLNATLKVLAGPVDAPPELVTVTISDDGRSELVTVTNSAPRADRALAAVRAAQSRYWRTI
jgi:acetoin utilization deacetylase AcuC-like enzyme